MTLAYKLHEARSVDALDLPSSLEDKVLRTISAHTEFSANRILTQDNRVKYARQTEETIADDKLSEVFDLMRQLNEVGVASQSLGRMGPGGMSFRQALRQICLLAAAELERKPIIYVELGPEPVKTGFILKTFKQLGIRIERYIAVDINPMSVEPMRANLADVLEDTPMEFITAPFDAIRLSEILGDAGPRALITMLGFQEGNDEPAVVNQWLRDIARPGDLLLSETQLYTSSQSEKIAQFYAEPAMQRFSRIAFEKAVDRKLPSLNRFLLLPVPFLEDQTAYVAILGEEFATPGGERRLHVSNFCLKLTRSQYRQYRLGGGFFEIAGETLTEDRTLHFQISRRL